MLAPGFGGESWPVVLECGLCFFVWSLGWNVDCGLCFFFLESWHHNSGKTPEKTTIHTPVETPEKNHNPHSSQDSRKKHNPHSTCQPRPQKKHNPHSTFQSRPQTKIPSTFHIPAKISYKTTIHSPHSSQDPRKKTRSTIHIPAQTARRSHKPQTTTHQAARLLKIQKQCGCL